MKNFNFLRSNVSRMDREWIGNESGLTRTSRGKVWRLAAMITLLLTLACGNVWGAVYKTYSLSDLTNSSLTYEVTGLSSNDQKLNKGERKVEVPCASASGTL